MAKKITKVTTTKIEETKNTLTEQNDKDNEKGVNVVNLEKADDIVKDDISEVVSQDTTADMIEKEDVGDNVENPEIIKDTEDSINESDDLESDDLESDDLSGEDNTEKEYHVDTPEISELIDSVAPQHLAYPPISEAYAPVSVTPVYKAQCPPKPATEDPNAHVAQKPY